MSSSTIRPSWPGFDKIKYLIIFGDSYSDVGYRCQPSKKPTIERPLGVDFPGKTWNEKDEPNWVGHLIKKRDADHPLLVYDFAIGGDDIDGVRAQVRLVYRETVGTHPDWAPWSANDSLFVVWIGINDCGSLSLHDAEGIAGYQSRLFTYVNEVYETGARNFLFIDVPPIERSPALNETETLKRRYGATYSTWNSVLRHQLSQFTATHADATVMAFSSYELFNKVLDNPADYGFDKNSVHIRGGSVWFDHLHITSQMHGIVADAIAEFLDSQAPADAFTT